MTSRDTTPSRRMLDERSIDDVANAIIALTRECWVIQDRQMLMEKVLTDAGIDMARIDDYQPDEAMREKLEARRTAMLAHVVDALKGSA
jgi:hypothetical protein